MPVMIAVLLTLTYLGSLGFFIVVRRKRMERPDSAEADS